jgi:hypothetical protein
VDFRPKVTVKLNPAVAAWKVATLIVLSAPIQWNSRGILEAARIFMLSKFENIFLS